MKKRILLVDTMNILHNIKYNNRPFANDLFAEINILIEKLRPDIIVLGNDKGGSDYRKELLPEYKGHRKTQKKTPQVIEREKEMKLWRESGLRALSDFFPYLEMRGVEFDDLATLFYKRNYEEYDIIIVSQDKDFLSQVAYDKVYDWRKQKFKTPEDRYGLSRNDFVRFQCLVGDTADNIPSFCGEKTALALLGSGLSFKQLRDIDTDGDIDPDVFPLVTPYNKRYIKKALTEIKTEAGWEQLKLNHRLVMMFDSLEYLTEPQQESYLEMEQSILTKNKDKFKISAELENFLESVAGGIDAIDDLEMVYDTL